MIAPAMDHHGAIGFVERLKRELETNPAVLDGVARRLTVRAGFCAVSDFGQSSLDAVELLLRAASALRRARSSETIDGSKGGLDVLEVPSAS